MDENEIVMDENEIVENKTNGEVRIPIKNTPEHFLVALAGVSLLLRQIENIEDSDLKRHLCQSAIEICDELLEDPKI